MNYAQAFELPIVVKIGDEQITFPVLSIADYDSWTAELQQEHRTRAHALIPRNADAMTTYKLKLLAERGAPALDEIANLVWTGPGAQRVLSLSLAKAGVPADQHAPLMAKLKPRAVVDLAVQVSGLFDREESLTNPAEQTGPNSPAAGTVNPDPAATGS